MKKFRSVKVSQGPILLKSFVLGVLFISACATTHRSVVAMKVSDEEAHIAMGSEEIRTGDHVNLFKHECMRPPSGVYAGLGFDPSCNKVKVGEGVVTKDLGNDYSAIKVSKGTQVEEGMTVEKQ